MAAEHDFAREDDRLRRQELARLAAAVPPPLDALRALTPGPFRDAVGLMFDRLGYAVMTHGGADALVMTKDGRKYLVACASPLRAEPTPPRELMRLHAAITAASAQAGYYVSLGDTATH